MTEPSQPSGRSPSVVEIRTPTRLHIGMFSFGNPAIRSFGGVGLMVDRPQIQLRMRKANQFTSRGPLAERALGFARQAAGAWNLPPEAGCEIDVIAVPRAHVGLGSGTQLALAVAAGVRHLHQTPAGDEPDEFEVHPSERDWFFDTRESLDLARAVGRGRRSCVGIHGFSRGGLIVEAGRPEAMVEDTKTIALGKEEPQFSPLVARVRLPSAWRCLVIVQRDSIGLHGEAEKAAFASLPPVPGEIAAELARLALLDILPAAVEGDFEMFSDAVHRYGAVAGRPFEQASARLPHAATTCQLIELLGELGIRGVAQSSWGPAVMACCESIDQAGRIIEQFETLGLAKQYEATIGRFDSQGAVLRVIE